MVLCYLTSHLYHKLETNVSPTEFKRDTEWRFDW